MAKTYIEYMREITSDDLYDRLLGTGLFSEKITPLFTSQSFLTYAKTETITADKKGGYGYIYFESTRNFNFPRSFGIPNPFAYECQCRCLKDHWSTIISHFEKYTATNQHKISKVHIRKLQNGKIFEMNYTSWRVDGTPELNFIIGKKYVAIADISNFFPSIYTHSLAWALVGKDIAKKSQHDKSKSFNEIDKKTNRTRNCETHGLLIGPIASNILSEVILTVIDYNLSKYKFIRSIDDYRCYTDTFEEADKFINDLREELRGFDLILNSKKTEIKKLPELLDDKWNNKITQLINNSVYKREFRGVTTDEINYKSISLLFNEVIELMKANKDNASIIYYFVKAINRKKGLFTKNASRFFIVTMMHLSIIYPYLITIIDEHVIMTFKEHDSPIKEYTDEIYKNGILNKNFELIRYALFFAIKYGFEISSFNVDNAIGSNDCLYKITSYLYCCHNNDAISIDKLYNHALILNANDYDLDRNWLFVYEMLSESDLKGEWKQLKHKGISFIKDEYRPKKISSSKVRAATFP